MHLHWLDCVVLLAYLPTIAVNSMHPLGLAKRFHMPRSQNQVAPRHFSQAVLYDAGRVVLQATHDSLG
jgi:hypothetical protein